VKCAMMMEAVRMPQMSVYVHETTRRHIPDMFTLLTLFCEPSLFFLRKRKIIHEAHE
jgi:hypothetical protein